MVYQIHCSQCGILLPQVYRLTGRDLCDSCHALNSFSGGIHAQPLNVCKQCGADITPKMSFCPACMRAALKEKEYVTIPWEVVENNYNFWQSFMEYFKSMGGAYQQLFDVRAVVLIDDKLTAANREKVAEMLQGHPTGTHKVNLLGDYRQQKWTGTW